MNLNAVHPLSSLALFVHSYVESDLDKNEYDMVIENLVNLVDPELVESDEDDNENENDQQNTDTENDQENEVTHDNWLLDSIFSLKCVIDWF